jgi:sigma-B regulation protein RsbU (phosphoserine phosphatase)
MTQRLHDVLARIGLLEKVLVVFVVAYLVLALAKPGSIAESLVWLATLFTGMLVAFRLMRRSIHHVIWRLRNRLIVAYLFIAVVPIGLIVVLVRMTADGILGQMAIYLVNSELNRRIASLNGPAEALARTPTDRAEETVERIVPLIRSRFPEFELLIRGDGEVHYPAGSQLQPPPAAWENANGLIMRDGRIHAWTHLTVDGTEVTIVAPITHELLAGLVPGLGEINFLNGLARERGSAIPAAANSLDFQVNMLYPLPIPVWDKPESPKRNWLIVTTRASAVLGIVYGQRFEWSEQWFTWFLAISVIFFIVELVALITGVRLTRTITSSVHEIYEGTQKVKEADFSHRIPVEGTDQLAELSSSFNNMTENLGRLIVIAKEKERLQSELEIAREVQNQLFPKEAPQVRGLGLTGVCNPARMVSGDYYDFIPLSDSVLGFAIGDVAGKGISAALLMAAIQSTMRSQLTSGVPLAAVAGSGGYEVRISTADVVSRLNRQLYANTSPEKYATFYFGLYDQALSTLTYTNAGHLPPMLVRGDSIELLEVTGTVVGAFPVARYEEKKIRLETGDILVAYTDGIVEPENVYGEMFGDDRLKDLLLKYSQTDSKELIARVMEGVVQWTGEGELQDDMTMVIARRL